MTQIGHNGRRGRKNNSRTRRAIRYQLVVCASRREDPRELYDETNNAILFRARIPRSFRRQAELNWRDYQEECAYVGGYENRHKNSPIDPSYIHPKKITKIRFCGYWQVVSEPREVARL